MTGIHILFPKEPFQAFWPKPLKFNDKERPIMTEELDKLLSMGGGGGITV